MRQRAKTWKQYYYTGYICSAILRLFLINGIEETMAVILLLSWISLNIHQVFEVTFKVKVADNELA